MLRRIFSVALFIAGAVWGVAVGFQSRGYGDGPPMGAICSAVPAVVLLIAGGLSWPKKNDGN